ncbi:MAG: RidA family protein [Planctomycetota bacterium]
MSMLETKLKHLGLELPAPAKSLGTYIPAMRVGDLIYTSGQIPVKDGQMLCTGTVPSQVSVEDAKEAAKQCVLNGIAAAMEMGVPRGVAKVVCFVASDAGFHDQPAVANGASDLLVELFGEDGRHARSAVGVSALPAGVSVEIEFIFSV